MPADTCAAQRRVRRRGEPRCQVQPDASSCSSAIPTSSPSRTPSSASPRHSMRMLDAAVAGPMLLETDGSVYPSGRTFPDLGEALGHGFVGLFWRDNPWTRRYRLVGDEQHRARNADWVSGASFLVRRDAFEAVGGFDEAYFMYVEDVDLCWRLHRAGWAVLYEPSSRVVHEQGRSTSPRALQDARGSSPVDPAIRRPLHRGTPTALAAARGRRARRPARARVPGALRRHGSLQPVAGAALSGKGRP